MTPSVPAVRPPEGLEIDLLVIAAVLVAMAAYLWLVHRLRARHAQRAQRVAQAAAPPPPPPQPGAVRFLVINPSLLPPDSEVVIPAGTRVGKNMCTAVPVRLEPGAAETEPVALRWIDDLLPTDEDPLHRPRR